MVVLRRLTCHGVVCVSVWRVSSQHVFAHLLSWPLGVSVNTDIRAKFTSIKVRYRQEKKNLGLETISSAAGTGNTGTVSVCRRLWRTPHFTDLRWLNWCGFSLAVCWGRQRSQIFCLTFANHLRGRWWSMLIEKPFRDGEGQVLEPGLAESGFLRLFLCFLFRKKWTSNDTYLCRKYSLEILYE